MIKGVKKICLMSLFLIMILSVACFFGCENKNEESAQNSSSVSTSDQDSVEEIVEEVILDWKDETIEVGIGQHIQLERTAVATNGKTYKVDAKVYLSNGNELETLNDKFIVEDKNGYKIEYVFKDSEKTQKRIVTLKVVALSAPVVEVEGSAELKKVGSLYNIPKANAFDYFDGDLQVAVKIVKKDKEGETEQSFNSENNTFEANEKGVYEIIYTAENSNKIVTKKSIELYVWDGKSAVPTEETQYICKIGKDSYKDVFNNDIASELMLNGSEELNAIAGDYKGNATRFVAWSNPRFRLKNHFSNYELYELTEKYNAVIVNYAVGGLDEGSTPVYFTAGDNSDKGNLISYANNGETVTVGVENQNMWRKATLKIDGFIDCLSEDKSYSRIFTSYREGGVHNGYIYVGDVQLAYIAPDQIKPEKEPEPNVAHGEIIKVSEYTLNKNIYNNAGGFKNEYVPFSDYEKEGMATDYTGDAIKITSEEYPINGGYSILPRITRADWDKAVKEGYTKMSVVVGRIYDHPQYGMGLFDGLLGSGQWDSIPGHTWKTFKFALNEDLANKLFDANGDPQETQIFRLWSDGKPTTEYPIKIYIGDIMFDEDTKEIPVDPNAPFVENLIDIKDEKATANIYHNDSNFKVSFASKDSIPQGDYVGNAVKISSKYRNNSGYKIKVQINRSQYMKAVEKGYKNVKVNFYFKPIDPSTATNMYITNYGLFTWQDKIIHDTWAYRTIEMNEILMNKLFDDDGRAKETDFFGTYVTANNTSEFELYIGNIQFVK